MKNEKEYKIKVLEGVQAVRQTSGMYIGNVEAGPYHLFLEILSNSVDEFLAEQANKIKVIIYKDESISISDNGRGIPLHNIKGKSSLEIVLTSLHSGGKFDNENYKYSGGLHGIGISATNFLSKRFRCSVYKDGLEYSMAFEKGKKIEELSTKPSKKKRGTFVRFVPDKEIFTKISTFDTNIIEDKLREISYLCKGLEIEFEDERNKTRKVFKGDTDISDFVRDLSKNQLMYDPIMFTDDRENIKVDVSLQWINGSEEEISKYYTNNIPNIDGGSHAVGFKSALTRTINSYIGSSDLPKTMKISLSGDDIREGIVSIVSIRHPNPKFSSQTKEKLVSDDARNAVENAVSYYVMKYFEQNPVIAKKIITQCITAHKAREAAKKAREATRKSVLKDTGTLLPGKLADCSSKNPAECEIFIVEGSSAGGSAKGGRDRTFQAILPLRGKVLNIEKCEFQKMMGNEEIMNIITALGVGIGKAFNINKLRYDKVILAADADVDGAHIRTLLLTFFFRHMLELIANGNLYIACPPLYKVSYRNRKYYVKDDNDLKSFIKTHNIEVIKDANGNAKYKGTKLQRFKGLGEMMPNQLWETTMNPETRTLIRVEIGDFVEADRIFNLLMGSQVEPRREYIYENALDVVNLDI